MNVLSLTGITFVPLPPFTPFRSRAAPTLRHLFSPGSPGHPCFRHVDIATSARDIDSQTPRPIEFPHPSSQTRIRITPYEYTYYIEYDYNTAHGGCWEAVGGGGGYVEEGEYVEGRRGGGGVWVWREERRGWCGPTSSLRRKRAGAVEASLIIITTAALRYGEQAHRRLEHGGVLWQLRARPE